MYPRISVTYGGLNRLTLCLIACQSAKTIIKGAHTTTFAYGAGRNRYKRTDTNSSGTRTTLYIGGVEKITKTNGTKQVKRTIGGVAIITLEQDDNGVTQSQSSHYLYKDHLGSLDVITDHTGAIVQEQSFDAWGLRRNAVDWQVLSSSILTSSFGVFSDPITTRGFTGHEMVDEVGIIHMNGRIYDPKLGRFLQADPFVQEPFNTQSLNRYSYVINNPLAYTDPSGFEFFKELFDDALGFTESPLLSSVVQIAGCTMTSGLGCAYFVAGFNAANTYAATGDFGASLKAGAIAGFSAAAFHFIGGQFTPESSGFWAQNSYGHIGSHAITGGVLAELQGGKFGHGFMSAGLTKALSPSFSDISGVTINDIDIGEVVMAATLGGSISQLTGGKFANGAVTAAFANILNAQGRKHRRDAQKGQDCDRFCMNKIDGLTERDIRKSFEEGNGWGKQELDKRAVLHNQGVPKGTNRVYKHADGREAVFTGPPENSLAVTGRNGPTYNYGTGAGVWNDVTHVILDVIPYYWEKAGPADNSTFWERAGCTFTCYSE